LNLGSVQVGASHIHLEKLMPQLIRNLAVIALLAALTSNAFASSGRSCPTPTQWELDDRLNDIEHLLYDLHHPNSQSGDLSPLTRLEVMHRRAVERERLWLTCSSSE